MFLFWFGWPVFIMPWDPKVINSESDLTFGESLVTTLELSAKGCPFTCKFCNSPDQMRFYKGLGSNFYRSVKF